MEAKMFKFGKVTLTLQSLIVLIFGMVLALITFAIFPNVYGLAGAIGILVLFGVYAYVTNCLIVGKCTVLSWIIVAIYALLVLSMIGNLTMLKSRLKQLKKSKK
jgi:hypothetical protein